MEFDSEEHEELLAKWKDSCPEAGQSRFWLDGVIDVAAWRKQEVRTVFVLKEPNGNDERAPKDLRKYWDGTKKGYPRPKASNMRVRAMIEYLLDHSKRGGCTIGCTPEERIEGWARRVAIINIKKTEGGGRVPDSTIRAAGRCNAELLRDQIKLIDPSVIVACSKVVDDVLRKIAGSNDPRHRHVLERERWEFRLDNGRKAPVIPTYHPGHRMGHSKVWKAFKNAVDDWRKRRWDDRS